MQKLLYFCGDYSKRIVQRTKQIINKTMDKPNTEIDIFEFCSRMWKAFKNILVCIKDFTVSIIIITLRKSLWIISFALFGVILGSAYFHFVKTPYYVTMLEGTSGGVDNTVVIDHVNKLNSMVGNSNILARNLGISVEQAEEVRSIRAFYGIDVNDDGKPDFVDKRNRYNPRDTTQFRVPSIFYIQVALYDEDVLPALREGLFRYINSNTYIQTLFEIDQQQKQAMISELQRQIAKIDTIQLVSINRHNVSSFEIGQRIHLMGSEPEIRLFYADVLALYSRKQELEKSFEISDQPVVVVQDFTPSLFVEKTRMYYVIRLGLIMGVLGFAISILWQHRKSIWKLIVEQDK